MTLVGLSGYAQVGKDTVGKILVEKYGFERVSFADKLREVLYALDPTVRVAGALDDIEYVDLRYLVDTYG